jgi:nucleoside-triphosphatase THEP1
MFEKAAQRIAQRLENEGCENVGVYPKYETVDDETKLISYEIWGIKNR